MALQLSGADLAQLLVALGINALLRNVRLSRFRTAPAAERQVR